MRNQPKVSVVMSVYNGEKYLRETLDTLINQSLREIEILLVCNGATDGTLDIMQEYASKDDRIQVFSKEYGEAGAGRNYGMDRATGKYISFLDGDDLFESEMLEKAYQRAENYQAEIAVFGAERFFGSIEKCAKVNVPIMENLPNKDVFSGKEILRDRLRSLGPYVWSKLFLRQFILDNNLRFIDQTMCEDTHFSVTAVCVANRICVLGEILIHYRYSQQGATSQLIKRANMDYQGFLSMKRWLQKSEKWEIFEKDFISFAAENLMTNFIPLRGEARALFYRMLHEDGLHQLSLEDKPITHFYKPTHYFELQRISSLSWEEYQSLTAPGCSKKQHSPELIVSMTSYPARISTAHEAIYHVLTQTEKADRVILWLAEEDFPSREDDLPAELMALKKYGLAIEWCRNIKSYQKLIPALQKYPDAVIVTADDDMRYGPDWLKLLWDSYKKLPNFICCHRPAMLIQEDGKYSWITSGKSYYPEPTYLHRCISHAGILYPPHSLHPDVFREDLFMELAETTDDFWFWIMGIRNGTKVNVADYNIPTPKYIEQSQAISLSQINDGPNGNSNRTFKRLLDIYPEVKIKLVQAYESQHDDRI